MRGALLPAGSPRNGDPTAPWRRNPHVQSYVVATDKVIMNVYLSAQSSQL